MMAARAAVAPACLRPASALALLLLVARSCLAAHAPQTDGAASCPATTVGGTCRAAEQAGDQALLQRSSGLQRHGSGASLALESGEGAPIHDGDQVFLRAYTGRRLTVQGEKVHSLWRQTGEWQTLTIERRPPGGVVMSGDKVTIRAYNGKRLSFNGTDMFAKWSNTGTWEQFTIDNEAHAGPILEDQKIFLTAWTGKQLDIDSSNNGLVKARFKDTGYWQSLHLELKKSATAPATTPAPATSRPPETTAMTTQTTTTALVTTAPVTIAATTVPTTTPKAAECAAEWAQCGGIGFTGPKCCVGSAVCVRTDDYYSQCRSGAPAATAAPPSTPGAATTPGAASTTTPAVVTSSTSTKASTTPLPAGNWVTGTWVTGYWDCCKPSCSWPNKGRLSTPIRACNIKTGLFSDPMEKSVCDGGDVASCTDNQPFIVPGTDGRLSMGFAAGAAGGASGLQGDVNCGQCYELVFQDKKHPEGVWGGSHPNLVGRRMVVQLTNIGYDVGGEHSFDIQIPGAGQGIFQEGCKRQFRVESEADVGAFDCGTAYGGCPDKAGCARLPAVLRPGCEWRYDWLQWLQAGGQTNNPYVAFRRVRCPSQLTAISGSAPDDDADFPDVAQ